MLATKRTSRPENLVRSANPRLIYGSFGIGLNDTPACRLIPDHSTFALRNLYQSIAGENLKRKIERDLETEH